MNPDWYPDPADPSQQRFWDGISWTEHIYGPGGRGTDRGLPGAPPPSAPGAPNAWPTPPDPQPRTTAPYGSPPGHGYGSPPGSGQAPGYGFAPGYGSTPGYGGYPAPTAWPARHGPLGQPTSPIVQILLTIVTLGIWVLVWIYRQYRDMRRYSGTGLGGGVGLLINFIPGVGAFISFFLMANEVQQLYEREGRRSPVTTVYGLLYLVPLVGGLIWYLLVQSALNQFWIGHGAPSP